MKNNYKSFLASVIPALFALSASGQGIINNGANIIVQSGSNIIVSSGGYTNGASGLINNEGTIKVDGDWTNNASNVVFTSLNTTGLVELNGGSGQTVGGSNPTTFENLTVSGTGIKTMGVTDNTVNAILIVDGIISLNSKKLIINNNSVAAVQQNSPFSSKHIRAESTDGSSQLQWNIRNAPSGNAYRYPFGNAGGDDIGFTFTVTGSGTESSVGNVTVTTYPTGTNNLPKPPMMPNPASPDYLNFESGGGNGTTGTLDRWWVIDANNYSTKPTSTMAFQYSNTDLNTGGNTLLTEANLKAQRFNMGTTQWNPPDFFGGTNSDNTSTNTVTVTNVSSYSPWVLHDGTSGSNSPLPITLVDFKGACNSDNVVLTWTTATESNNDYFEVQRSVDGTNYATIAIVDGAGNSNAMLNYTYSDHSPNATGSYYRLNQVDFNGANEAFSPKYVRCSDTPINTVGLYPNPTDNLVNVSVNLSSGDYGAIMIYNSVGQLVSNDRQVFDAGMTILPINTSTLAQGHYFVDIKLQNTTLPVQKLVITR